MISRWLPRLLLVLALASVVLLFAIHVDEGTRAASFFGAGALVLTGALLWIRTHLRYGMTGPAVAVGGGNLLRLALRSAARRPGRSTLTIGLVASACFLILAVSVFHIDPAQDQPALDGGDGGFALVAQSDQPVYHDLNTPAGRKELDFTPEQSHMLDACTIFALRSKPGDDASCLNLYQPRRPRLLGLPQNFLARGGFAWDASSGSTPAEQANPWLLLRGGLPPDADGTPRVPVVLESATAMYSLHLWNGVGSTYDIADGRGGTLRLVVVGLLSNSIFQGDLLISEENLLKAFPDISGYRFFLIQTPPGQALPVRQALEGRLGDYGFAAETSTRRLAGFLAVQNTYLSTFQSLGSLGLLLGTVGLAAVQLRNVFERRGELALLRATGFRRRRLATMVLLENCLLLVAGQAVGGLAAVVATLPHWASPSALTTLSARALVTPGFSMAIILGVGLLVGLLAVRSVLATPLLAALRRE